MELQVTITLSDQLFDLLEDKLPNLGRRVEKAVTKEIGSQVRQQSEIGITVVPSSEGEAPAEETTAEIEKPRRGRRAKTEAAAEAETERPAENAAEETRETEQPAAPQPAAQPVEKSLNERIREIIHVTRQRFEGEDYKDNAASEAYQKYHKPLTGMFLQIAVTLGYAKPSLIDTPEKVDAFAAECEALVIDEKGLISAPAAPY